MKDRTARIKRLSNAVENLAIELSDACETLDVPDDSGRAEGLDQASDKLFDACVAMEKAITILKATP